MSFRITKAAIHNQNVAGMHKLILIIIADHENEHGSWPSIDRIASMAGLARRQTQRYIRELEEKGEIIVLRQDGHHGANRYFVVNKTLQKLSQKVIHRGVVQDTGGVIQGTGGVSYKTPEQIKKDGAPPASGRGGDAVSQEDIFGTPPGYAGASQTNNETNHDTPTTIPPRCLHNPSKSALKCKQCSTAYIKGEI